MGQKRMRIALAVGLVYAAAAICVMAAASMNRIVVIEDAGHWEMLPETGADGDGLWKELLLKADKEAAEDVIIPLGEGIKAENVTIENRYMDKEVLVSIDGADKYFYTKNEVGGNLSAVEDAAYERREGVVRMRFGLDGIYECQSVLEGGRLRIKMMRPDELYEKRAVIDPWHAGDGTEGETPTQTEEEILLDIVKRVEEKMRAAEDIRIYYTSMGEGMPSLEEKEELLEVTGADFYIGIDLNRAEDSSLYGVEAVYNGTYFIPKAGSVELADILVRSVTTQVSGRARGLVLAAEEDRMIQGAAFPAAAVKVGYLSNREEAQLLESEGYRDKIAEGIYEAVLEFYEKREQIKEDAQGRQE